MNSTPLCTVSCRMFDIPEASMLSINRANMSIYLNSKFEFDLFNIIIYLFQINYQMQINVSIH